MSEAFDWLQNILLSGNSRYAHSSYRQEVRATLGELDPVERARTQMLLRLSMVVEQWADTSGIHRAGPTDLLVLLRQVIRAHKQRLLIPHDWWQQLQYRAWESSIHSGLITDGAVEINAAPWQPAWLLNTDKEDIESLEYRRTLEPTIGDGMLAAFSNGQITTYRSEAQKLAVDTILRAPPGASILVTLPTGGGKSMCILLPAWMKSGGGRLQGGTSIVVVPTVSLALDQQTHVAHMFQAAAGPTYRPYALTGDTVPDIRASIYQGIRDGTLPILYTSPESLLNNRALHESVLYSAEKGFLNWLVIDEAHMVEQWGAGFRTEFQLLAAFRQQLLIKSQGAMRTLLLSATVSDHCKQVLADLFGGNSGLATVMGNQLRPEISYWQADTSDQDDRRTRILEALHHFPRPAILYVTRPVDAEGWVSYLREKGYERIAAFSGNTDPLERAMIMSAWTRDELDIIVATSAFGLGVDKEEVRTVIHATIPENMDRFYQEVGRGGRDGCKSVSLLCSVLDDDILLARSMSIRSRITTAKAWSRWLAMWEKRRPHRDSHEDFVLDLESTPAYNPEMSASDTHLNWNEHVLLLMQRAGVLTIVDANPQIESTSEPAAELTSAPPQRRFLHIKLYESAVTYSEQDFNAVFEPQRRAEYDRLWGTLQQMRHVVLTYSKSGEKADYRYCLSHEFAKIYPNTAPACGGCADCRSHGYRLSCAPISVECEGIGDGQAVSPNQLMPAVSGLFASHTSLHLFWTGNEYPLTALGKLLPMLLQAGFTQFILPSSLSQSPLWMSLLLDSMRHVPLMPVHRLLSDEMLVSNSSAPWQMHRQPTVIVYPTEPADADKLYKRTVTDCGGAPCIQIVNSALYLPSQYGRFLERVNGRHVGLEQFFDELQKRLETL